jgi:protein TonB
MLAYAANRPAPVERKPHPNAMLMVIGVHVALLAALMSAKMDLPRRLIDHPPTIFWVPKPEVDPLPHPTQQRTQATNNWIDRTKPQVTTRPIVTPEIDTTGTNPPHLGEIAGTGTLVIPEIPRMIVTPVKSGPQLLTPVSELKPPYPSSKLINEEEAALTLRLTIDANGRVVAVQPVGRTDAVFLEAARKHLIAHWRYKPAMDDGQAVISSMVVTLRFQLDG